MLIDFVRSTLLILFSIWASPVIALYTMVEWGIKKHSPSRARRLLVHPSKYDIFIVMMILVEIVFVDIIYVAWLFTRPQETLSNDALSSWPITPLCATINADDWHGRVEISDCVTGKNIATAQNVCPDNNAGIAVYSPRGSVMAHTTQSYSNPTYKSYHLATHDAHYTVISSLSGAAVITNFPPKVLSLAIIRDDELVAYIEGTMFLIKKFEMADAQQPFIHFAQSKRDAWTMIAENATVPPEITAAVMANFFLHTDLCNWWFYPLNHVGILFLALLLVAAFALDVYNIDTRSMNDGL